MNLNINTFLKGSFQNHAFTNFLIGKGYSSHPLPLVTVVLVGNCNRIGIGIGNLKNWGKLGKQGISNKKLESNMKLNKKLNKEGKIVQ